MINIYNRAKSFIGLQEIVGPEHNPTIVQMFKDSGHSWVTDDETAWCAAFVGSVLSKEGEVGTGELNARSYLDWGVPVHLSDIERGDIVILWRDNKDSWKGHVAFYEGTDGEGNVLLIGGNQSNSVNISTYPVDRILGVRRVKTVAKVVLKPMISSKELLAGSGALLTGGAGVLGSLGAVPQTILVTGLTVGLLAFGAFILWNRVLARKRGER